MPGPVRSEFFGDKPAPFPDQLFMSAETLVDTALAALDQGEAVCFPALHDLTAVNTNDAINVHAERRGVLRGMSRFGGGDQQFRRHTSDARAGGAVRSAFNQDGGGARRPGGAIRRQTGATRADNGYIGLDCVHEILETLIR